MRRREEWRKALDAEVKRWSALPYDELQSKLRDIEPYEIDLDGKKYQVEVEILKQTEAQLQVLISVDDGSLPASFKPEVHILICEKR